MAKANADARVTLIPLSRAPTGLNLPEATHLLMIGTLRRRNPRPQRETAERETEERQEERERERERAREREREREREGGR
jgi:hypothetical protein